MHPVKWFHRGTAPMVAIYPDDIDGSNALKPMSAGLGLRPVNWSHNGSAPQMAIYPDDVDGTLRPIGSRDERLSPVHWFHRGTAALAGNFNSEFVPPAGGGEEYEGPIDISAGPVFAYGQRAMSAAVRGQAIYTINRDSDQEELIANSDASTGAAPVAAINAFLGVENGSGVIWNDASGAGRDLNRTQAFFGPEWQASAIGGKPAFHATDGRAWTATTSLDGGAYTLFVLASFDTADSPTFITWGAGPVAFTLAAFYNEEYEVWVGVAGNNNWVATIPIAQGAGTYILEVVVSADGTDVKILANGVDLVPTLQSGVETPIPSITDAALNVAAGGTVSTAAEIIAWNAELSAPTRLALRQNIATYYGVTLP